MKMIKKNIILIILLSIYLILLFVSTITVKRLVQKGENTWTYYLVRDKFNIYGNDYISLEFENGVYEIEVANDICPAANKYGNISEYIPSYIISQYSESIQDDRCIIINTEGEIKLSPYQKFNKVDIKKLSSIPDVVANESELEDADPSEVYIINNEDDFIDKNLLEYENLKILLFGSFNVENLSEYKLPSSLLGINLSLNHLEEIEGIEGLNNLLFLDLSSNNIGKIENMDNLTSLEYLNLSENDINKIENVDNLTNLTYLDLADNNISKIENLNNLKSLTNLDISSNNIYKIENIDKLINLADLNLSNNNISKIENLNNLTNLQYLNLSNNNISKIENIEKLPSIRNINLSDSNVKYITQESYDYIKENNVYIYLGEENNLEDLKIV